MKQWRYVGLYAYLLFNQNHSIKECAVLSRKHIKKGKKANDRSYR